MTWVTPSGAIVNDAGQLIALPPTAQIATTTIPIKQSPYVSKVYLKTNYIGFYPHYNHN